MTDTTKKILYGVIAFVAIIGLLWGAWKFIGTGTSISSAPVSITVSQTDHMLGNQKSKVTIVEFSDFQCPACKAYQPLVKALNAKYKDQVRFVFKHFPLPSHPNSQPAALAAIAASKQGKFWEMHDILFDKQDEWSPEKDPSKRFTEYAKQLKLDIKQFEKDLNSTESKNKMNDDMTQANQIGVNSTPSFYINGKKIQSVQTIDDFSKVVDQELKSSK